MKKFLLSICGGCLLTWALYAYIHHHRSGPGFIRGLIRYTVELPLYLLLSLLSPDGPLGEVVGWSLTVLIMSFVAYLAFRSFGFIFRKVKVLLNKGKKE